MSRQPEWPDMPPSAELLWWRWFATKAVEAAELLTKALMGDQEPDLEQKLAESLTAEASAYRAHIRALLADIATLVGKPAPELSPALHTSIDALFQARRTTKHDWLQSAREIVVHEQLELLRAQDSIAALVKLHIDELAAAGLNTIEVGKP